MDNKRHEKLLNAEMFEALKPLLKDEQFLLSGALLGVLFILLLYCMTTPITIETSTVIFGDI